MADGSNEYETHLTQLGATLVRALTEEKRKTEAHLVALLISEVRRLEREREEIYAELLRTRHTFSNEIEKLSSGLKESQTNLSQQMSQVFELESQLERLRKRRSKTNG